MWLSGRKLASNVRGLGSNPVSYTFFIFKIYYIILLEMDQP